MTTTTEQQRAKRLGTAITTVISLSEQSRRGLLDTAGAELLRQAREHVASRGGLAVMDSILAIKAAGLLGGRDPRGPSIRTTRDIGKRPVHADHEATS